MTNFSPKYGFQPPLEQVEAISQEIDFSSSESEIEAYIEDNRVKFYEDWFNYIENYD